MTNIVEWIVEEVSAVDGGVKSQRFTNYEEALDIYNHLKSLNEKNFVSIQKSEKKLLVE